MKYWTPIINFDFHEIKKSIQIGKIEIKNISDRDLLNYFGITSRTLNKEGILTSYATTGKFGDFFILNEFQKAELFACKYAFVSNLQNDVVHRSEISSVLNALRLFKLNGVICPITINDEDFSQSFMYPLESKIKEKMILSRSDLEEVRKLLISSKKIEPEDSTLLEFVSEQGKSILSLVFLVITIERTIMKGDRSEISFKVRLYGSKLLRKYFMYREKDVFETLGLAYKLRSDYVHQAKVSLDKVEGIFPILYDYTVRILTIKLRDPNILKSENRNSLLFQ